MRLIDLVARATGRWPPDLGGEEINGVEIVLWHAAVHGVASHYARNRRPLTGDHRELLRELLREWDLFVDDLPSDEAQSYFEHTHGIAIYLLANRLADSA